MVSLFADPVIVPPCPGVRVVYQNREEEKNALAFFDPALRRGGIATS